MGDHWLYGKSGFFDQSYHIPMIVRMPDGTTQGRVAAFTEHVDVMPTMLEWLGVDVPRQCDGRASAAVSATAAARRATGAPRRTGNTTSAIRSIERRLGLTLETSTLNVVRSARHEIRALRRSAAAAVRSAQAIPANSSIWRRTSAHQTAGGRLFAAAAVVAHAAHRQNAEPSAGDAGDRTGRSGADARA